MKHARALVAGLFVITLAACAPAPTAPAPPATTPRQDPLPGTKLSVEQLRQQMFHVSAGRRLKPTSWPNGARVAVGLSFDVDNATATLSTGNLDYEVISRGEYGAVDGVPRLLRMLDRQQVPASFFIPAVSAVLHPQMLKDIQASPLRARNRRARLDSRTPAAAERREGGAAPAEPVDRDADADDRQAAGRLPRAVVEVQRLDDGPGEGGGVPLRQQPDGQRRCLRTAAGRPADRHRRAADRADPGRLPVLRRQRRRLEPVARATSTRCSSRSSTSPTRKAGSTC